MRYVSIYKIFQESATDAMRERTEGLYVVLETHVCIARSCRPSPALISLLVPQQPYSAKAQPRVYIPEDSWPADQSCKLSHTLGGKNSYTTLSQPYTPFGQSYTRVLWYKSVIPLLLRGLEDTLLGLHPRSVYVLNLFVVVV